MKKKDYEEFEEFDDFDEFEEEVEDFEEDEYLDDEEIEDAPKKAKKSKPAKKAKAKKSSKGKKIGIAIGVIAAVAVLAVVGVFVIMPLLNPAATGNVNETTDFSVHLKDYQQAPTSSVISTVTYDVASILDSTSYSDEYKAAATMLFTTGNEAFVNQYAYFRAQVGTTDLGSNSGTLLYQRIRRETTDMKYDTTLKYPINHNFNAVAVNFVTDAAIRYIREDGQYFRFKGKNHEYNEETGIVSIPEDNWGKESSKNWNRFGPTQNDLGVYLDMIKINANVGELGETVAESTVKDDLIKAGSVTITKNSDYYVIKFSIDAEKANQDSKTCDSLDESNGGSGIKYEYCDVEVEMWNCGLAKSMTINEKWGGKIQMYTGAAEAKSVIKYSYSDRDCTDVSFPNSLIAKIGE